MLSATPDPQAQIDVPPESGRPTNSLTPDLTPEEQAQFEARRKEVLAQDRERYEQLRHEAHAIFRAAAGWNTVDTPEAWERTYEEARQDYFSGRFLIERLGAERFLDPKLMATLSAMRRQLLVELPNSTMADCMLADGAILGYYNTLRVQNLIGSLALHLEHEFFAQPSPTVKANRQYGRLEGLTVEDHLRRLGEQLFPLLDRASRMTVRNLKAMRELRRGPAASVAIGRADQVNVAETQANAVLGEP